jgi:hypothetical protein
MRTLFLLALGLLLTIGAWAQRRPRPQAWRCPVGPAYLPARLPRRPSQQHLDSLANVARRRALLTAK